MPQVQLKPNKIILNDEAKTKEWCDILNCEKADLLNALSVIGNSAQAVDDYLVLSRRKKNF